MAGSNYYYPTILLSVMLLRYFSSEFSHIYTRMLRQKEIASCCIFNMTANLIVAHCF